MLRYKVLPCWLANTGGGPHDQATEPVNLTGPALILSEPEALVVVNAIAASSDASLILILIKPSLILKLTLP